VAPSPRYAEPGNTYSGPRTGRRRGRRGPVAGSAALLHGAPPRARCAVAGSPLVAYGSTSAARLNGTTDSVGPGVHRSAHITRRCPAAGR